MTSTEAVAATRAHAGVEAALDERTRAVLERRRSARVAHRRGWLIRRALAGADVAGLTVAFALAVWLFGGDSTLAVQDRIPPRVEGLLFVATLPLWIVVAKLYGLYDRDEERTDHSTADEFGGVFHMITIGAWGVVLLSYGTPFIDAQFDKIAAFWVFAIALVSTFRACARAYCHRRIEYLQNAIIVGAGDVGQLVAKKYLNHPEYGINLVGFVDSEPRARREDLRHLTLLGGPEELPALVGLLDVERVVLAFSSADYEAELDLIRCLKEYDVQVDVVPRLYEVIGPGVAIHTVEGVPLLGLAPPRLSRSSQLLKRAMDLALTIPGLVAISPLLLAIAVAIKLQDGGPVFFRQVRMGANGTFRIWKFRTMWIDADARKQEFAHLNKHLAPGGDPRMFKIDDDPRVTRVGHFLRRHSLDELPQLFNVLNNEMSLVGPRPLILEEAASVISPWAKQRLTLKPGITGIWQILGRDRISFEEMLNIDYLYVTGWKIWNDFRILVRTATLLLGDTRTGASFAARQHSRDE